MRYFTQFINSFPGLRALPIPPAVLAGALLYLLCGCAGGSTSPAGGTAHTISGTITPASAANGVTVTLSGASSANTTTDGSGHYSFTGLADGTYVVSPSHPDYIYNPALQTITLAGSSAVANFSASQGHSVRLSWNPSSSDVAGYNLYRGTTDGGPYTKMNAGLITTDLFVDTAVHSGNTYYYVSTSVDVSGKESPYSTQATAEIP